MISDPSGFDSLGSAIGAEFTKRKMKKKKRRRHKKKKQHQFVIEDLDNVTVSGSFTIFILFV